MHELFQLFSDILRSPKSSTVTHISDDIVPDYQNKLCLEYLFLNGLLSLKSQITKTDIIFASYQLLTC